MILVTVGDTLDQKQLLTHLDTLNSSQYNSMPMYIKVTQ